LRFPRLPGETEPQLTETITVPVKQPEPLGRPVAPTLISLEASGHLTKIELSGGRYAAFTIPDHLTNRDAQRLKGALLGLSQIIDSMVDEDEGQH